MTSEVGSGQVSITPSFKGFRKAVTSEVEGTERESSNLFARAFGKSSTKIGQTAGKGFKDAFSSSSKGLFDKTLRAANDEYIASSRQLSSARLKEQDASGKVRVAEVALAEARKKTGAESARSVAAEERLATAQRNLGVVQDTVRGASTRLAAAKLSLADATNTSQNAATGSTRSFRTLFSTLGNSSGMQGALGLFRNLASSIGGALVSAVETAARSFLTLSAVIGGIAAYGFVKFVKDAVGNASDLVEAGTAIGAVFGDATDQITKFAKGSARSIGQSTTETLDAAKSFGIFGKAAGLAGGDLASFSTDFVTLAADLASFNNTSPAEAVEALGAGLRGESEPLRKYGILLDDATLKARATELGIYSGSDALTQQQRVLAAHAEILAQTSTQQGDFAKTSEGLANQQRIAAAQTKDLSTSFGSLFLPAVTTVMGYINNSVLPGFQALSDILGNAGVAGKLDNFAQTVIDKVQGPLQKVLDVIANIATSEEGFSFENIRKQFTEAFPGLDGVFKVLDALAPILPAIAEAFVKLGPVLGQAIPKLAEVAERVLPQLVPLISSLLTVIGDNAGGIELIIGTIITSLGFVAGAFQVIADAILGNDTQIEGLLGTYGPVWQAITSFITDAVAPINHAMYDIQIGVERMQAVFEVAQVGVAQVMGIIQGVIGLAAGAVGASFQSFGQSALNAASTVGSGIGQVISTVAGLPGQVGGAISSAVATVAGFAGRFFSAGSSIMGKLVDGIRSGIGAIGDAVGAAMDEAAKYLPHSPALKGVFSGSGWPAVADSGAAIMEQFGAGARSADVGLDFDQALRTANLSGQITASAASSAGGSAGGVPEIRLTGDLAGLQQFIQAEIKTADGWQAIDLSTGKQKLAF